MSLIYFDDTHSSQVSWCKETSYTMILLCYRDMRHHSSAPRSAQLHLQGCKRLQTLPKFPTPPQLHQDLIRSFPHVTAQAKAGLTLSVTYVHTIQQKIISEKSLTICYEYETNAKYYTYIALMLSVRLVSNERNCFPLFVKPLTSDPVATKIFSCGVLRAPPSSNLAIFWPGSVLNTGCK